MGVVPHLIDECFGWLKRLWRCGSYSIAGYAECKASLLSAAPPTLWSACEISPPQWLQPKSPKCIPSNTA
jgi:hypothetical protein